MELSEATALQGMHRSVMLQFALAAPASENDDPANRLASDILRTTYYPSFVACVCAQTGFNHWPISYEEFAALPEAFVIEWERATFALNPHWAPGYSAEAEKKIGIISSE